MGKPGDIVRYTAEKNYDIAIIIHVDEFKARYGYVPSYAPLRFLTGPYKSNIFQTRLENIQFLYNFTDDLKGLLE